MERKGQAAMEFLMTYGWAILAAIIAIAVLAYFGVFNPGRYTSEMCQVSAPFTCDDNSIARAAGVDIILRNGGDEDFTVTNITVSNCNDVPLLLTAVPIASGKTATVTAACTDATGVAHNLGVGTAFRGNIDITYHKTNVAGARELTATGSITRKKVTA